MFSWYRILLICSRIQFASIWLGLLISIFIKDIGLYFFLVMSLPDLDIRVALPSE